MRGCPDERGVCTPSKFLRTVYCRKKFTEHPDTPALILQATGCAGVSGREGGGGVWTPSKFLRTVDCRKKFTEHPDTPALTLHRYRIVCFSATMRRNILSLSVNLTLTPSKIGTRPIAQRRKGLGTHLTFQLSPSRNVDLTNQKR